VEGGVHAERLRPLPAFVSKGIVLTIYQ
jgi:hypothetical protein